MTIIQQYFTISTQEDSNNSFPKDASIKIIEDKITITLFDPYRVVVFDFNDIKYILQLQKDIKWIIFLVD